jgi:hypothetical protein
MASSSRKARSAAATASSSVAKTPLPAPGAEAGRDVALGGGLVVRRSALGVAGADVPLPG